MTVVEPTLQFDCVTGTRHPDLSGDSPSPYGDTGSDGRSPGPDDVLRRLIRLVADRAHALGGDNASEADALPPDLGPLREAVDALEQHLRTLVLLRRAEGFSAAPDRSAVLPPAPTTAPEPTPTAETEAIQTTKPEPSDAIARTASDPASETTPMPSAPDAADDAPADGLVEGPGIDTSDDALRMDSDAIDAVQGAGGVAEADASADDEVNAPEAPVSASPDSNGTAPATIDPLRGRSPYLPADPADPLDVESDERDFPPFRDQVTGLHSQEGFDAVAGGELKRCRRYGRVYALLLFQVPGTDVATLRRAANAIRAATRESDLVGRHVDRSLAVALPETQANQARLVAERIIRHLEGVGAWDENGRLGLVTHPAHGETLVHLVQTARDQLDRPAQQVLAAPERGAWPD